LWFAVINAAVTPSPGSYGIQAPGIQRTMLELYRETDRTTARLDPSLEGIKYWFVDETVDTPQGAVNLADVFDSYVSTRGWLGNLLNSEMTPPPLETLTQDHLQAAVCVGLLSSVTRHDGVRRSFVSAAAAAGIPAHEVLDHQRYRGDGLQYALSVYRVVDGPANGPPCQPGR
jgi:hypothetical protein